MMDPMDVFRSKMLNKVKYNLHLRFFRLKDGLVSITVPIVTPFSNNSKITPFRNPKCQKANCVYDISEIIQRYKQGQFAKHFNFVCPTCKVNIDLNDFVLDASLQMVIEEAWPEYNNELLQCKAITIYQDNSWVPVLPAYQMELEKNLGKYEKRYMGQEEAKAEVQPLEVPNLPPLFGNFDNKEYDSLSRQYHSAQINNNKNKYKVLLKRYAQSVSSLDVRQIEQEVVSPAMMTFFLSYLNEVQSIFVKKAQLKKGIKVRVQSCFFLLAQLNGMRESSQHKQTAPFNKKTVEYANLLTGEEWKHLHKQPQMILRECSRVVLVFRFDGRWIAAIGTFQGLNNEQSLSSSNQMTNKLYVADFLSADLKGGEKCDKEICDVAQAIVERECGFLFSQTEKLQIKQIDFFCDCGIYVMALIWKCTQERKVDALRVTYNDKEQMKSCLLWLIFKLSMDRKHKVQVVPTFQFGEDKSVLNTVNNEEQDKIKKGIQNEYNMFGEVQQKVANLYDNEMKELKSHRSKYLREQNSMENVLEGLDLSGDEQNQNRNQNQNQQKPNELLQTQELNEIDQFVKNRNKTQKAREGEPTAKVTFNNLQKMETQLMNQNTQQQKSEKLKQNSKKITNKVMKWGSVEALKEEPNAKFTTNKQSMVNQDYYDQRAPANDNRRFDKNNIVKEQQKLQQQLSNKDQDEEQYPVIKSEPLTPNSQQQNQNQQEQHVMFDDDDKLCLTKEQLVNIMAEMKHNLVQSALQEERMKEAQQQHKINNNKNNKNNNAPPQIEVNGNEIKLTKDQLVSLLQKHEQSIFQKKHEQDFQEQKRLEQEALYNKYKEYQESQMQMWLQMQMQQLNQNQNQNLQPYQQQFMNMPGYQDPLLMANMAPNMENYYGGYGDNEGDTNRMPIKKKKKKKKQKSQEEKEQQ